MNNIFIAVAFLGYLHTATGTMIAMTGDTLDLHYVIKDC
jgi:hypothetical protein